jgi:long-chain fatty acid transport protein
MRNTIVAALVCVLFSAAGARAGGIFVPGLGPQAQARAGAFVAKADDPSAIWHNPAGFAKGEGTVILLGANLLSMSLSFDRAGVYEPTTAGTPWQGQDYVLVEDTSKPTLGLAGFQAIPIFAVTTDLGLDLKGVRFAAGLFAPHGYPSRDIRSSYEFEDALVEPPPSRYDVVSQEVVAAFPTVGVSYSEGDWLDIGIRASWGIGSVKGESYVWALENYEEDVTKDGFIDLDVSDSFVPSFGVGALYRPSKTVEIGLAYNSWATIDAQGHARAALGSGLPVIPGYEDTLMPVNGDPTCETTGNVANFGACAKVTLPMSASVGARYKFMQGDSEVGDVELDVKWENWSAATDVRVIVDAESLLGRLNPTVIKHGFRDTVSARLGGSYSFPVGSGKLLIRGGAAYDTAAAPTRWQRLDMDGASKMTIAGGLGYEAARYRVEIGGGGVIQPNRDVVPCNTDAANRNCPSNDVPSPALPLQNETNQRVSPFNGGSFKSGYVLLSLGVTTWF